jgi:hypothetical protein
MRPRALLDDPHVPFDPDVAAIDDDDYRRGRLTNHKVFGDAIAISPRRC